jgi:hypothetical protein
MNSSLYKRYSCAAEEFFKIFFCHYSTTSSAAEEFRKFFFLVYRRILHPKIYLPRWYRLQIFSVQCTEPQEYFLILNSNLLLKQWTQNPFKFQNGDKLTNHIFQSIKFQFSSNNVIMLTTVMFDSMR